MTPTVIDSFSGEYRFLSNFYTAPITLWVHDRHWTANTVEHPYQASKATSEADFKYVMDSETPGVAKSRGREIKMNDSFEHMKLKVMYQLVKHKFDVHPELKKKLLDTGDALLIEGNHWGDTFWGVCKGRGTNHLGQILMRVRSEFRAEVGI